MPIYERTYRSFDGELRRRFRWAVILRQELKVLVRSRVFLLLLLLPLLHCILRLLQVVAYDAVAQNPNNPLAGPLSQIAVLVVNEKMFLDFIRLQTPLVFLLCLYAGSGMICGDFSNNLMEIYFSKPISWLDYTLGKILTLVLLGLGLTAAPAVILVVLHNLLAPGMETLRDSYWWPGAILAYSLIVVLPCALVVLASSALLNSRSYASICVFLVLMADSAMGELLADLLHDGHYRLVSFPMTLTFIGDRLFNQVSPSLDPYWGWWGLMLLFVAAVCLWALWVLCRRVRRAEIAA